MEIGLGFFLVRMGSQEDYEYALTRGPCVYLNHSLELQPWTNDFDPDVAEVSNITTWEQILRMCVDYYEKVFLYVVGSQIGKVLKVDTHTLKHIKGHFTRLCVGVDKKGPFAPIYMDQWSRKRRLCTKVST